MQSLRILIVEDELFVALDAEAVVVAAGHSVVGLAATTEEAIASAERTKPDLILMDIRLKGQKDGIDAAIEIRKHSSVPVIFVTAHTDEFTRSRAFKVSPLAFISKPFAAKSLLDAIALVGS